MHTIRILVRKMIGPNYDVLITVLKKNGLNSSIKRNRLAEGIKKQDPSICCLEETHFTNKDTETESEWMRKDIPWQQKVMMSKCSHSNIRQNYSIDNAI